MADAWIRGQKARIEDAVERTAALLADSRMPVIAGLGTDVAGARAAIALAERIGGAVDHMHSAAMLRQLDVMRTGAMLVTTPHEARLRGDVLLLAGPGLTEAWPAWPERLMAGGKRHVVWLCPGAKQADPPIRLIGDDPAQLPDLLGVLRARIAGRPVANNTLPLQAIEDLAAVLKQARFGVAVWSVAHLDGLCTEMLAGLVKDLNAETRFTSLPMLPGDNAGAVQQVSGWKTGFPMRVGFGRGFPEHDPWRFDAVRLVDSGEADCALWISAMSGAAPAWRREIPTIALMASPDRLPRPAEVAFAVGRPGVDHDAVEYLPASATLAPLRASHPVDTPAVADVLTRIGAALPAGVSC